MFTQREDKAQGGKAYEDFLEAFWQLYEKKDINRIKVKEICEIAGYNRSTFYNHFADVYDVLEHIENNILLEFMEMLNDGSSIWYRDDSAKRFSDFYKRNSRYLKILANEERESGFLYKLIRATNEKLDERVSFCSDKEENDLAREYHINGSIAMIMKYFRGETNIVPEKIIDFAISTGKESRWQITDIH